jgi:ferredoxin, 2Fe-2S
VSVMEALRSNNVGDVLAICGGCCSCATCHVFVDEPWLSQIPPISIMESELLDSSNHRNANSRLSCQIKLDESLNGMKVTVAPDD